MCPSLSASLPATHAPQSLRNWQAAVGDALKLQARGFVQRSGVLSQTPSLSVSTPDPPQVPQASSYLQ